MRIDAKISRSLSKVEPRIQVMQNTSRTTVAPESFPPANSRQRLSFSFMPRSKVRAEDARESWWTMIRDSKQDFSIMFPTTVFAKCLNSASANTERRQFEDLSEETASTTPVRRSCSGEVPYSESIHCQRFYEVNVKSRYNRYCASQIVNTYPFEARRVN